MYGMGIWLPYIWLNKKLGNKHGGSGTIENTKKIYAIGIFSKFLKMSNLYLIIFRGILEIPIFYALFSFCSRPII